MPALALCECLDSFVLLAVCQEVEHLVLFAALGVSIVCAFFLHDNLVGLLLVPMHSEEELRVLGLINFVVGDASYSLAWQLRTIRLLHMLLGHHTAPMAEHVPLIGLLHVGHMRGPLVFAVGIILFLLLVVLVLQDRAEALEGNLATHDVTAANNRLLTFGIFPASDRLYFFTTVQTRDFGHMCAHPLE